MSRILGPKYASNFAVSRINSALPWQVCTCVYVYVINLPPVLSHPLPHARVTPHVKALVSSQARVTPHARMTARSRVTPHVKALMSAR